MTDLEFNAYYRQNINALQAFARKFTNNQVDIDDLVQEYCQLPRQHATDARKRSEDCFT